MKGIAIFLILLCFAPVVKAAEVYQWVDEQGVTYFTDDPAAVPEDYRSEAKRRQMPGEEPPEPVVDMESAFGEGILVQDDLKEKDEAWWREQAEKWKAKLKESYDSYEQARLQYNTKATEFNRSEDPEKRKELKAELDAMQVKIDEFKADIEKARQMTEEVLPTQAEKAGKPLEWVR
jgi:hypothetical protein